jgi:hypothetical protein
VSISTTRDRVEGNPFRIRDPHAEALIEIWIVSAVVAILLIRAYLALTGYPQVGGGNLHIAHMLWGGLGMIVGFGMLMIFAHHVWKPIAALVAGAGFGTFIDELGKFITKDNDYFFQPTIALIYGIIVALFLLARYLGGKRVPTDADHLYYAGDGVQWALIGKLDARRRDHALEMLAESGDSSPFAGEVRYILENAPLADRQHQSRLLAFRDRMEGRYWRLVSSRRLERVVIGLFVLKGIEVLISIGVGVATGSFSLRNGLSFAEWGATLAAVAGGLLALWGVVRLLQSARVAALKLFASSVLVSILFGQFFAFASIELLAMGKLVMDLVVLGVVRFALAAEHEKSEHEHVAREDTRVAVRRQTT